MEQKYYNLDQLPKAFDTNLPEIKSLIDLKKLTPQFFLQSKKLVIGGIDKDRMFVGYGIAEYEGMVSIQRSQFLKLWGDEKIDANFLVLHDQSGISNYSQENPFTAQLPSGYIKSWQSTPLSTLTRTKLIAICAPQNIVELFCFREDYSNYESLSDSNHTSESQACVYHEYKYLTKEHLSLNYTDVLISRLDLINVGIISKDTCFNSEISTNKETIAKLKNEFEELIANIIIHQPRIQAKQLHRIICDECMREEDNRLYDKKNILLGEDQGIISWRDKYSQNRQRSYNQASLVNVISKVRGKIAPTSKTKIT